MPTLPTRAEREQIVRTRGQWVGVLDRDFQFVMEVEDWQSASWGEVYQDTANMQMVLPGEIAPGVQNPLVRWLLQTGSSDPDGVFHDAVTIVVERRGYNGNLRRFYRILDIIPEGGRDYPETVTVTGLDGIEYLKHLPLWADPSTRSKVVQMQFEDKQQGSAEWVSRKLVGRNLIGYQQPGMFHQLFDGSATGLTALTDGYDNPKRWRAMVPEMHRIICSPISSGLPSEWSVVCARWDNAFDLLRPTWEAAGILPIVSLWLPGDYQPFPDHTTLTLPTVVVDFRPVSMLSGARTLAGQGIRSLTRKIDAGDQITSATEFSDAATPTRAGKKPWVVFDCDEAPKVTLRKSTDSRFLVGGKSPKVVNTTVKAAIKGAAAYIISFIPGIGPPVAEAIRTGGDILADLSADHFLNLNEHIDRDRQRRHGRSGYLAIAKQGEANSMESIQKAWQAKTETNGGLSVEFAIADAYPYLPGRDFQLGDTVGFVAWGEVWAAYVSSIEWTSAPGEPVGFTVGVGDVRPVQDPEALFASNVETIRGRLSRLTSTVD
ncbi:hypothetical protein [Corynebacterium jeddahense]|uniref:Gp28/Gp37-like domain-containing protein n=1 Tax=Corynebacterium jeddahense TaxID=1414719 RepID=A0ABY7UIX7_9CORY|nr:hypothetical protein [Corynebacterium jeddahense]WCZ37860.1 hypothetical protein CJEDD_01165 [Corynebacterium jeddahense]